MNQKYSVSFRIQAVQKALNRSNDVSLKHIAESLGVGYSTLQLWIRLARKNQLDVALPKEMDGMTNQQRPQDWNLQERLDIVITCGALDEEGISTLCRAFRL